jgi:hypothetical protein
MQNRLITSNTILESAGVFILDKATIDSFVTPIKTTLLHAKANPNIIDDGKATAHIISIVHATAIIIMCFVTYSSGQT